jgi:hypothetical protein
MRAVYRGEPVLALAALGTRKPRRLFMAVGFMVALGWLFFRRRFDTSADARRVRGAGYD